MGTDSVKNDKIKNTEQIQQYFFDYLKKVNYKGTFGIAKFTSVFNDLMPVQQKKLTATLGGRLKELMGTGSIISLGIFYPAEIIDHINVQKNGVVDKERWDLYSDEYQHLNEMLIEISDEIAQKFKGIAFPPTTEAMAKSINSVIEFYPHAISHRVVAGHGGVGWRGKSELIITETHGPAVRFTSVVINIPLKQNEKIEQLAYDIEAMYSSIENNTKNDNNYQEKISYLVESLTSIMQINKKLSHNLLILNNKIDEMKSSTNDLQTRIDSLNVTQQQRSQQTFQNTPLNYLTPTEKQIIQLLLEETKTAPEIQRSIKKTREHTSRLLKKLWQEGYIERETHTIPFIYRPTKELESRVGSQ